MRRTLHHIPRLLLALLTLSRCAAESSTSGIIDTYTGCTGDWQCPTGYSCDPGTRTCVENDTIDVDLVLEISPLDSSSGSGYQASQYVELAGRLDELDTEIVLSPTTIVKGLVSRPPGDYVESRLEFTPRVEVFPQTLRGSQMVSSTINEIPDMDNYLIALLPGTYDVTVSPRGPQADSLPPLYPAEVVVEPGDDLDLHITFPESFRTLSGTLRLSNDDPVPHSLDVWAVDASTGERVSTVASTGALITDSECAGTRETGQFCLVLSPSASTVNLRVAPGDGSSQAAAYPGVTLDELDLDALDADGDGVIDLDTDLGDTINLPVLGDLVVYKAMVEGIGSSGLTVPVEGASVNFTVERDGASFDIYSITNSAGEICQTNAEGELVWGVMLRENVYQVTIIPPMGEEFESLVLPALTITYSGDGILMGQVYQLATKKPFVARVESRLTSDPMEGLTVEAYPVSSIDTGEETYPLPRYNDGLTGVEGLLRLDLDRGVYDVLVRSTLADGVPWAWLQNKQPDNEDADLEIQLPEPVTLSGWVSTADGSPAASALISVHQVVHSPEPDEPPDTRLIWDTTTGDTGSFTILLSP